jgi:hypothetical protein
VVNIQIIIAALVVVVVIIITNSSITTITRVVKNISFTKTTKNLRIIVAIMLFLALIILD